MKLQDNLSDTARESRAHEGNSQRGDGMKHGEEPLLPLGKCLGVVRVVGQEVDDIRRVVSSFSGVGVVHDSRVNTGRVEDEGEVADVLGHCCLAYLDIGIGLVYHC